MTPADAERLLLAGRLSDTEGRWQIGHDVPNSAPGDVEWFTLNEEDANLVDVVVKQLRARGVELPSCVKASEGDSR